MDEAVQQRYEACKERLQQFYHAHKDKDCVFTIPLVILALIKIVGHVYWRWTDNVAFPPAADSQWYLDYARALLANFKIGLHINDILYFGYNSLLAVLLAIFKEPIAIMFVQAVAASFSVILVYKIAKLLFNKTTAVIAALMYYNMWEMTLWTLYILSDSFFISLQLLCVYLLLVALESRRTKDRVLFGLAALYMAVFRPTGVLSLAFIMLYILIRMPRTALLAFLHRYRFLLGAVALAGLSGGACLYALGKFAPFAQSFEYNAKLVLYNVYAKGWIYDVPTPYDHFFKPNYQINEGSSLVASFIVNNWADVLTLYGKRALSFWGKWVWEIDLRSTAGALKLAWYLQLPVLFLTGTIAAVRNNLFRRAAVLWLVIMAVALFCTVLFIDAMYRYKAPAVPFICIIAAYGGERMLSSVADWVKTYVRVLVYEKRENTDCRSGL